MRLRIRQFSAEKRSRRKRKNLRVSLALSPRRNLAQWTKYSIENAVAGPSTGVAPTAQSLQFHFGGDADDDEEEEEEEPEQEEEQDDEFETAFNILDMARATWAKVEGVEAQKKTAECYRLLGDTAMECGQSDRASVEFN